MPEEPLAPDVPELPSAPEVPDEPVAPAAPEVPLEPEAPVAPEVPEEPDAPVAPDVPEVPFVPPPPPPVPTYEETDAVLPSVSIKVSTLFVLTNIFKSFDPSDEYGMSLGEDVFSAIIICFNVRVLYVVFEVFPEQVQLVHLLCL